MPAAREPQRGPDRTGPEQPGPELAGPELAVGDPRRQRAGRAIFAALQAAVFFSVTCGPVKEIKVIYDHAAWLNDPFDTVVSFAMFFVPLITACCLARLPLCRRAEPLPAARLRDLLRGCRVVLAAIVITLVSEWAAIAIGANRPAWNWATWLQAGLLGITTVLAGRAVAALRRAPVPARPPGRTGPPEPDWLTDMVTLAGGQSRWLGPLRRPALTLLSWLDRKPVAGVRRHPVWAAAAGAAAFGVAAGGVQAVREGYVAIAAVAAIVLLGCGMFALLVGAGSYLGLVRASTVLHGARRRALDAGVLACAGMIIVLAFRNSLWWIVGSSSAAAGLPQAWALLGLCAAAVFIAVFAVESMRRSHQGAAP